MTEDTNIATKVKVNWIKLTKWLKHIMGEDETPWPTIIIQIIEKIIIWIIDVIILYIIVGFIGHIFGWFGDDDK